MKGVFTSLGGALLLAAVSTLGDLIWANWIPSHRAVFGLIHGALLLLVLGGYLGALCGRVAAGAAGGAAIGLNAAAAYYLLAPLVGAAAMFAAWFLLWVAFALLDRRLAGGGPPSREAILRGLGAGLASGLAFYAISGIWLAPGPGGPDYALHFASWTVAFLPGFLALLVKVRSRRG